MFCKKGVLRNFEKLTGKHLFQRLFFNKVVGLSPATLLKKSLWRRCFPANFAKFLRTPFFTEHLRWLLQQWRCYVIDNIASVYFAVSMRRYAIFSNAEISITWSFFQYNTPLIRLGTAMEILFPWNS